MARRFRVSAGALELAVRKAKETEPRTRKGFLEAVELALTAHEMLLNDGEKVVDRDRIEKTYSLEGLNTNGNLNAVIEQMETFDRFLRNAPEDEMVHMNLFFYGPPGTGKSELARYMGNHLNREVITRRISDIQSKWVGESEQNIREAFETAEREEAILVIDEVDSLLFSRDRAVRSWEISLTNEFLTSMERFRGILICTSNRIKDLDEAAIRRFNHKLGFGYLTGEGNVVFYKRLLAPLAGSPLSPDAEACLKDITHLAPGDFKTVKDRYAFYGEKEVTHQIMVQALAEEAGIKKIHRGETAIGF